MAAVALSKKQLKLLRGLAHDLDPIVQVGRAGVTDPVVTAVGRALLDHELIKIRLLEPEDKRGMAQQLAERSTAALCGLIGHTVILYKKHPKTPRIAV
jgi:RNA-binding protein